MGKTRNRLVALFLLLCFAVAMLPMQMVAAEDDGGAVHIYAPTGDDPATPENESPDVESVKYQVSANETLVPAIRYNASGNNMDVVRFASTDATPEFKITLKNSETINSVTVYPERYYPQEALQVSEDKKTLTFTMTDKLRYAIVMINGSVQDQAGKPYLTILNDPPEDETTKPKLTDANVLDFQAFASAYLAAHPIPDTVGEKCVTSATIQDYSKNDSELMTWTHDDGYFVAYETGQVQFPNKRVRQKNDVSDALQAALETIKNDPALDTLYIPSGTYLWSGLRIDGWNGDVSKGGKPLTIYTEEGALLKNRLQECREALEAAIHISNSSYVTVSGRGMYDGQGAFTVSKDSKDARNSPHQGGSMVLHSNNIVFNDTYLRDAKQWNWECHTVTDVTYNNIKGLSPYAHSWVDGLDLTSGVNVIVNGAVTLGNDDCFASGHYNPSDEFPRRIFTENRTEEMTGNRMAAAYYYNKDRLNWDTADSENIVVRNSLHFTLNIANAIRTGHNTIGSNPSVNGSAGRQLKSYTFENFNPINFAQVSVRIQNANLSSYPRYEKITLIDCSFSPAGNGNQWALIPTSTSGSIRIPDVLLQNCWFANASAASEFRNITNLTVNDLYMGGKLVRYSSQVNMTTSGITNFVFTANGKDVLSNTLPSFTSPASTSIDAYTNNPLSFTVAAADPDAGDTVTLDADEDTLPAGASFDRETGAFFWRAEEAEVGNTYTVTFSAYDDGARDGVYAPAKLSVNIHVLSATETKNFTYVKEDTVLQTWNTEKNNNYGRGTVLKGLHPGNRGVLGTGYTSTSTSDGTDIKLSLMKFDLTDLLKGVEKDDFKVDLALTYIGHRNSVGNNDMVSIGVFAVDSNDWAEGTGVTNGTSQTGNALQGVTWNNKSAMTPSEADVRWSDTFVAGSVVNTNSIQTYTGVIDGRIVRVDVSDFVKAAKAAGKTTLTLAFGSRETSKEIYFMSKDGIGKFTGANDPALAPALALYVESDLLIQGPDALTLTERYGASSSDSFILFGKNQPVTVSVTGDEKISWNGVTHRLDIAPGLKAGVYPVVLTATDAAEHAIVHNFTLTVLENNNPHVSLFEAKPALVQGMAANLTVNVQGEKLGGDLTVKLDGKAYPVVLGEQRVHISAAPAVAGTYDVELFAGDSLLAVTTLEILSYSADIWRPEIVPSAEGVEVRFSADITPKGDAYEILVGGQAASYTQTGNSIAIQGKPDGATTIVIKGVKYAKLFPSYSFTFTLPYEG